VNGVLNSPAVRRNELAGQSAVLDALTAHIALIDANGQITTVNKAWCRFATENGLAAAKFAVGENYLKICDDAAGPYSEGAKHVAAGIRRVLAGATECLPVEYPCHSPTEHKWFLAIITAFHSASNGALIMHVDVSDRRSAELRFKESEAEYLLLLNSTAEGIYRLDTNGICTFCNPAAARLLGYEDPSQIIGRSAHALHHHSRADGTPLPVQDCKVHSSPPTPHELHRDDEVFIRADGSRFPVEYWSHPILSGPNSAGTVVTFLDISARRELEARYLQVQKMDAIGRLAGGVAHDFNNALQVILTYAEFLEERLTHDIVGTGFNAEILSAGRRAASLTRQLLAFSRKQLLRPILLDVNRVISDIEIMLRRIIGEDVTLTISHSLDVSAIEVDRSQLEQVLINLAINARDAMPAGGELRVSTSNCEILATTVLPGELIAEGNYVMVCIRDTGIGMDQKTQLGIFEPFFTTKASGKGTGLGLATVYGIVKQSSGYIVVDSQLGRGTEFRLYFPAKHGKAEDDRPRHPVDKPRRGSETIVLVEDEHALLLLVSNTLKANGYRVFAAEDGRRAILLAQTLQEPIDLLLTDVILPGVSGRSVADQLRIARPSMKVIYMSGYTDDFITDHGIIDSHTLLLEKPFPISLLLSRIREILDGNRQPSVK
jgi:two-component system, cell cycle sensor histidine kinase and response regulator CckA